MAKKRRSPAQRAATARMLAANKRTHRNPTKKTYKAKRRYRNPAPVARRRRTHRNPAIFAGSGILKELLSMEGAMMIGAAMIAPMAADYIQSKVMPSATGYTKLAIKGGVILGGAWLIAKFLRKPKVALAFGVTGAAVLASDIIKIAQGTLSGLSADQADFLATNPMNAQSLVTAGYQQGLADTGGGYQSGLADAVNPAFNSAWRNQWAS